MTKTLLSTAIMLMLVYMSILQPNLLAQEDVGLRVVVTFPFMIEDIKSLLCYGDEVFSITSPGIDPHEYQLTPKDIGLLSIADLIISTAHTPFEAKIKELTSAGELGAKLIEIPGIPGLTILENPSTGNVNYHGLLFHGGNYAVFIRYIASALSTLRPGCSDVYHSKANELIQSIEEISTLGSLKGLKAIIDSPVLQYLVAWLGAEVEHIVMIEHDVPILPRDIDKVQEVLRKAKDNTIIVLTEDSVVRETLTELAHKFGVRAIAIPNPITSTSSIIAYLRNIAIMLNNTFTETTTRLDDNNREGIGILMTLALVLALIGIATTVFVVLRNKR